MAEKKSMPWPPMACCDLHRQVEAIYSEMGEYGLALGGVGARLGVAGKKGKEMRTFVVEW